MLALQLPREIQQRPGEFARRRGRTRSVDAREVILRHIEDFEENTSHVTASSAGETG